jgi:hypothetical protein
MIPIDSRFCSYCSVDLSHPAAPFELGGNPDAGTAVLGQRQWNGGTHGGGRDRTQAQPRGKHGRHHMRHPLLLIAAIFAISFIIKMIIVNEMTPDTPADDGTGSTAAPDATGPNAYGGDVRLATLRQALDDAGYRSVRFRLNGNVLEIWGTVPDEFDRVNVQALVYRSVGIVLLQDNLRVGNEYAAP